MTQSKELILVAGNPGSGKSTTAESASRTLSDSYYFSIGAELRAIGLEGRTSALSAEVSRYKDELRAHLPLPAHLAHRALEECILHSPANLIIVDGYPQYIDRLPGFYETLEKLATNVLVVCEIDVDDDVARIRLQKRENRIKNFDEDAEFIERRLQGYQTNAAPTLEQLARQYPLRKIDGSLSKAEVADALVRTIREYL